jgi:hypothetical protein
MQAFIVRPFGTKEGVDFDGIQDELIRIGTPANAPTSALRVRPRSKTGTNRQTNAMTLVLVRRIDSYDEPSYTIQKRAFENRSSLGAK